MLIHANTSIHSRQSPEQVANALASRKIALHLQLVRTPLAPNQWLQDEWERIVPTAREVAAQRGMDGRHADEVMIEKWSECLADYRRLRGRPPSVAEAYVTHCPCQESSDAPSSARLLDGTMYPESCRLEPRAFCLTGTRASMRWRVYHEQPFQSQSLDETYGSLVIAPLPAHIVMPPGRGTRPSPSAAHRRATGGTRWRHQRRMPRAITYVRGCS
jgi:hypothetical protein